jgi:integrase
VPAARPPTGHPRQHPDRRRALPGKSVTGEYAFEGKLDNPVTIQVKVRAWDARSVETGKQRGAYIDRNAGRETFRSYADRWLAGQLFAPSTRARVASDLRNHIYPVLGDRPLAGIGPSTVQAWARSLSALAPNTQHQIFGYVGTILSAAVDDQLVARNAARMPSVRRPRKDRSKVKPWPRDRVPALAQSLPERYAVVVSIGAGLGLRQGEIFGLAVEDVDFSDARSTSHGRSRSSARDWSSPRPSTARNGRSLWQPMSLRP